MFLSPFLAAYRKLYSTCARKNDRRVGEKFDKNFFVGTFPKLLIAYRMIY